MQSYLFLADGFEEVEALGTIDVLRRAGMEVSTVSINAGLEVTGAHGVTVKADRLIADLDAATEAEWLICPGGLPGATNLAACEKLSDMLRAQNAAGRNIAAICASPAMVLAPLGLLEDRRATCYPGCEQLVTTVTVMTGNPVETDGNITTGNGPANTFAFALAIAAQSQGKETADAVASGMLLR